MCPPCTTLILAVNHSCDSNISFDLSFLDQSQWHVNVIMRTTVEDPSKSIIASHQLLPFDKFNTFMASVVLPSKHQVPDGSTL